MTPLEVRTAIERSWSADTTYCPDDWSDHDPAWGQCAVTSVLLAELYGGDLRRGLALMPDGRTTTHYWLVIDGVDVDLTWRQFPVGTALTDIVPATRDVLVANRWMEQRCATLRARFDAELAGRVVRPWRREGVELVA